jgi:hypothetical protein
VRGHRRGEVNDDTLIVEVGPAEQAVRWVDANAG